MSHFHKIYKFFLLSLEKLIYSRVSSMPILNAKQKYAFTPFVSVMVFMTFLCVPCLHSLLVCNFTEKANSHIDSPNFFLKKHETNYHFFHSRFFSTFNKILSWSQCVLHCRKCKFLLHSSSLFIIIVSEESRARKFATFKSI